MMDMNRGSILLLLFALASLILLSGCTGGASYTNCCVRSQIYNVSATPPSILDAPSCMFSNGTLFGRCDKDSTAILGGTANCTADIKGRCSDIKDQQDCEKPETTCQWKAIQGCVGKESPGFAYALLPICTDAVPSNCIADSCTAMACGYAGYKIGPSPTAQDFNTAQQNGQVPFPQSQMSSGALNLQGTSCQFKTMDNKFYNEYRQSQGSLWINSFRIGVGRSFSDYEQSRYFFPASDKFCSTSAMQGKDRFLVYLNADPSSGSGTTTWCGDLNPAGGTQYYFCSANKLNFSDSDTCSKYCFGGKVGGTPDDCHPQTASVGLQKWCRSDNFVYNDKDLCRLNCPIISDPNKCTMGADLTVQYPFLDNGGTDNGRFRMNLLGDYYYGTNTAFEDCGFFSCDGSHQDACKQSSWRDPQDIAPYCFDYSPWNCQPVDDANKDCLWTSNGGSPGYVQHMDWRNSREFSSELDSQYYKDHLLAQVGQSPAEAQFECSSGTECLSGSCDTVQYNRVICKDKNNPDTSIYCGCSLSGSGYDCGQGGNSIPFYTKDPFSSHPVTSYGPSVWLNTGKWYSSNKLHGPEITASDILFDQNHGNDKYYYIVENAVNSQPVDPSVNYPFVASTGCNIAPQPTPPVPGNGQVMCLARVVDTYNNVIRPFDILVNTNSWQDCVDDYVGSVNSLKLIGASLVYVWEYHIQFTAGSGSQDYGSIGKCKLLNQPDTVSSPYRDARVYGGCQPCTSSTLAVQKVTFDPGFEHKFNCLDFRATYDYSVQGGAVTNGFSGGIYDSQRIDAKFDVSQVVKGFNGAAGQNTGQDGTIGFNIVDPGGFFSGTTTDYTCLDGWGGYGSGVPLQPINDNRPSNQYNWHDATQPSQAYLIDKMKAYMQANVMPILDLDQGNANLFLVPTYTYSPFRGVTSVTYDTGYKPLDICDAYGADGTAIYVVGGVDEISNGASASTDQYISEKDGVEYPGMLDYFNANGDVLASAPNGRALTDQLSSRAAEIYKACTLKTRCP